MNELDRKLVQEILRFLIGGPDAAAGMLILKLLQRYLDQQDAFAADQSETSPTGGNGQSHGV